MRLIDADKLIQVLNDNIGWESTKDIQVKIMEQPTAYDVNKVVENMREHNYYSITVDEAVKIVKGGLEE
jgi:hypothetical protein